MIILQAKNLKKHYGRGANQVKALDDVSLTVEQGEFVSIVGTSGSGKSTLLHLLGGLDTPTAGEVWIEKQNIYRLSTDERTIFRRRKIGFIFQSYNLLPMQNVYENVTLPIRLDGNQVNEGFIDDILFSLNLTDKKFEMPQNLSGGQQQRVAIARALATKPAIIFADEPTGNLDSKTTMDVLALLKASSEKFGQTIVMITHEVSVAQLADRIVRIEDGRIKGGGAS
ncbi:ABC transporter ATP-binding protein [Enterococcus sp. 669A]|uniref:ABC transporter ATP-binding protein n=1 Tax=Candidatus Enterococcus moelleringii TaxID=2815325 RepID=A0ABS3LFK3_9ENTE|nr:ABC transporter ATP-binding protein [Enterococcus sp. 669A]MBO1308422.1 ABC transporter ATP-binding protein [Enterococcus sp. 669A]